MKNGFSNRVKTAAKDGLKAPKTQAKSCSLKFQTASVSPWPEKLPLPVLVVDIGGSHVKILSTNEVNPRRFSSGPKMTPAQMVAGVLKLADGWRYEAISIGYPGAVLHGRPVSEPHNLATGWVGFDFTGAFGCPVKLINDAAMQAMGAYVGGKMLFLGLGTGLGSAMIADGFVEPMELGHLPYKKGTYEDYLGKTGRNRLGKKAWLKSVKKIVSLLMKGLEPDYVVIGGGNAKKLGELPTKCSAGNNADAFKGGFRLWGTESDKAKH